MDLSNSEELILFSPVTSAEFSVLKALFNALVCAPAAVANGALLWTRNRKHYPMPELSFYE